MKGKLHGFITSHHKAIRLELKKETNQITEGASGVQVLIVRKYRPSVGWPGYEVDSKFGGI